MNGGKQEGGGNVVNKLKIVFSFFLLIGTVSLLAKVDQTYNLYNLPYLLIAAGFIGLVFLLLATNKEASFLCRIGFHKFKRIGQDSEIPALYVYRCERCGKQKKAISIT